MSKATGKIPVGLLQVACRHKEQFANTLGYKDCNMNFVKGHIEYLDKAGIADESVDLIISNCVINLSPDKERVFQEAYRVLAPGGEMYFSDIYSDRRVSEEAKCNKVCLLSPGPGGQTLQFTPHVHSRITLGLKQSCFSGPVAKAKANLMNCQS